MNYLESVAYIESLAPTILNPSLDRFALFMEEQGRLQDKLVTIHIGGTNGKGSTVAIVDSVLRAAGLKVGRFTGPHLLHWNERFHIDGLPITDERFAAGTTWLRKLSEDFGNRHPQLGALTWFEFLTALAFYYFWEEQVDIAVFEVGLGGRWDATNVLSRPVVSAITTIDLDHVHILGETVEAIAGEKAGIIKPAVPVVTAAHGKALEAIAAKAQERQAPLYVCQAPDMVSGPEVLDLDGYRRCHDLLALPGAYQQLNGLVAAAILELAGKALKRTLSAALPSGFADVYWPGRLQVIPELNLVLDGAHNPSGARALRAALDELFPNERRCFILSFFQNKNVRDAIKELIREGDRVFAAEAHTARATCDVREIIDLCTQRGAVAVGCTSIKQAWSRAHESVSTGEVIIGTGSFATVKETMLALGWHSVEQARKTLLSPI
jgi:dihydrofolate synthase / folylpolyglutamate synthase